MPFLTCEKRENSFFGVGSLLLRVLELWQLPQAFIVTLKGTNILGRLQKVAITCFWVCPFVKEPLVWWFQRDTRGKPYNMVGPLQRDTQTMVPTRFNELPEFAWFEPRIGQPPTGCDTLQPLCQLSASRPGLKPMH